MLTPPSELPPLPKSLPKTGLLQVHLYTLTQIITTVVIFIVTLTVAGPAFPIIIIALVPIRLTLMKKMWHREVLRYVDSWACRDGCPEDDEDRKKGITKEPERTPAEGDVEMQPFGGTLSTATSHAGVLQRTASTMSTNHAKQG